MTEEQQLAIFMEWQRSHSRAIYKIVRAYADLRMDRDDLFQDIAIQLWHSIPAFKSQSSVLTWVYRVALNTALKWVRKERGKPHHESLESAGHILNEQEENLDEELNWLYSEIYAMSLIDRCLVLLLLDDFSYKEMADILGISESNVGVKINRIKKYLSTKSKRMHYGT